MNIIDFENIYVSYNVKPVLENINLKINEKEHWAILGSNGSGKSTLLKLFSNDLYPNTKYKFKKSLFGSSKWDIFELKKKLGIITNDIHNYFEKNASHLSAYEVVKSGFKSSIGIFEHQKFDEKQHNRVIEVLTYLDILNIKDKKVAQMSTGQLRRCVIGRALIHKPKAFILDEPTVGLDIKAQKQFIQIIRKLSKDSSIILVTHHIEEVFPEISHVALMYKQTLHKQGPKNQILNSKNLSEIFDLNIEIDKQNDRYFIKSIQ